MYQDIDEDFLRVWYIISNGNVKSEMKGHHMCSLSKEDKTCVWQDWQPLICLENWENIKHKNIYTKMSGFEWNWSQFFHFMKQDFIWEHVQPALDFFFPDERCEHIEWRSPTESWLRRSRPSLPDHPRGSKPQSSMGIYESGVNSYNRVHLQPSLSVFILSWELYSESLLVFIYQSLIKGRKCHHFQSWLIFQVLIS